MLSRIARTTAAAAACHGMARVGVRRLVRTALLPRLAVTTIPKRTFLDKITNKLKDAAGLSPEAQKVKAAKEFQATINQLLDFPKFSLTEFNELTDTMAKNAGAQGWKSYLPGVGAQPGMEGLKTMVSIGVAFSDAAKTNPDVIDFVERRRVSEVAKASIADVNDYLKMYRTQKQLREWLLSRRERGLPFPADAEGVHALMMGDPPKSDAAMKKLMKRSSRGGLRV